MSLAIFAMIQEFKARLSKVEAELAEMKAKWGSVSSASPASSDKVGEKSTLSLKKAG